MSNTRTITAIIAFVATFIFSAGLVRILFGAPEAATYSYTHTRCHKKSAGHIEAFIRQDIRNGDIRMEKIIQRSGTNITPSNVYFAEFAEAVTEYSDVSGRMDDSRLPQDLQMAWRKHMDAWRNFAVFLNETSDSASRKTMSVEEFKDAERRYNKEINRTWYEVLRIGRSYGADVY